MLCYSRITAQVVVTDLYTTYFYECISQVAIECVLNLKTRIDSSILCINRYGPNRITSQINCTLYTDCLLILFRQRFKHVDNNGVLSIWKSARILTEQSKSV